MDIMEAYDFAGWLFIENLLKAFSFLVILVQWVMHSISSTIYFVVVSGSPLGFFDGRSELRKGDPTSPFLFV